MELNTPKGTRDLVGKDALSYNWIVSRIRHYFTLFGFEFILTPHFERMNILTSKFSGGEEITKEIFSFQDQGKRNLGLRYDHTIPLSRFVSSRPDLQLPFQRATIGTVFRDGPIKLGRLREFTQADCDIYGAKGIQSEVEILSLMSMIYEDLEIEADIQINHRKLLEGLIELSNINSNKIERVMLTLDKLQKVGKKEVIKELKSYDIEEKNSENIFMHIENANKDITLLKKEITGNKTIKEDLKLKLLLSIAEIEEILSYNIKGVRFEATLARGLNYYTGIVFESFIKDNEFKSAISAGGRYRSIFTEGQESVGVSFGIDAMIAAGISNKNERNISIYIIPIKDNFTHSHNVARVLRKESISCGIDVLSRAIGKNLKYAAQRGFAYALIIGDEEVSKEKYTLRNLNSGEEQKLSISELLRIFAIEKM
jgi:histidyl-tRNA synthetase